MKEEKQTKPIANELIIDNLFSLDYCLRMLEAQGYKPIDVQNKATKTRYIVRFTGGNFKRK